MSLQWVAVAGFLYVEIGITLLLILPLLKPSTWKWIFSIRIFSSIPTVWTTIFYSILITLVVLFVDSIRVMVKYGEELPPDAHVTLDAKIDRNLRECRGQRNFYITGFALFLILVIHRLVTMTSKYATLEASHDATLRQARAANAELQRRIDQEPPGGEGEKKKEAPTKTQEAPTKTKGPTQEEYDSLLAELKESRANVTAIKKQAESTNAEYDRLAEENQKLQNRLQELETGRETQKDK